MSDDLYMDAHLIRSLDRMNFGEALEALKLGKKVAREGWNGKGMFLFYHAHVDMKTADNKIVPWLCSQTDMLAEDWTIVS